MRFQPTKNDDPQLDFCTVCRGGAVKYGAKHVKKYNEDLNTILIFVRSSFPWPLRHMYADNDLGSVYSSSSAQPPSSMSSLSSIQTQSSGQKPTSGRFSSSVPFFSRWGSQRSFRMERTTPGDHHNLGSTIREPSHFVIGRIRRDAGQTAALGQIPPPYRRIDDRMMW